MNSQDNQKQAVLLAYLAGIIDGEGTVGIVRTKPNQRTAQINYRHYAYMSLGMVEKQIPDLLKEVFGGCVNEERVHGMRSVWRWHKTGRDDLIRLLNDLLPYLRIKRPQAELVIDFCKGWEDTRIRANGVLAHELQRREDFWLKAKKLNAVGAAATTNRGDTREGKVIV